LASVAEALGGVAPTFEPWISELVQRSLPSVVQVRVHGRGAGTGVIWDSDGGVITNYHVAGKVGGPIEVLLADGRKLSARIVRGQPAADLALLEIPAGGLAPARVGDSARLRVGELVFAIGHPWGWRTVITAGIVSGIGEVAVQWGGLPAAYIRSDVQLAPGFSGGPLINAAGQVIGVNAMIMGGDLSVAIPSQTVQRWLASAANDGGAAAEPSPYM
jgi:serine protease Do